MFPAQFSRFTGRNFSSTGCWVARFRRLVTPVDGLHLETPLRKFRRRGGRLVSGWKQLSDTNYQFSLSLPFPVSLFFLSFSLYGDHSAKTPCCQDFAGSYSPELADVQIAEPLSQHLYPVFPRRPNRITIAKRKFSHWLLLHDSLLNLFVINWRVFIVLRSVNVSRHLWQVESETENEYMKLVKMSFIYIWTYESLGSRQDSIVQIFCTMF